MDTLSRSPYMIAFLLLMMFAITLALMRFCLPVAYSDEDDSPQVPPRYQILVLGDIGRSPRMQYHAISMGKHGGPVDLIGYLGTISPDLLL